MATVGEMERLFNRVGQILTIGADAPIVVAAKKMTEHSVGCLIVLDKADIVGICTDRDIVGSMANGTRDGQPDRVRDRMTRDVIYCTPETPVGKARRLMAAHGIRHLPIISDGVAVGMISSRDMLAYRLYETSTRLAEAKKDAKAADEAKSKFLSNVGYEVRTPMTGIIGMTDLVLDTALTDEQRDFLGIVKESAQSLMSTITNILDFSEVSAGKVQLSHVEFDLRAVLDEELLTQRGAATDKSLAFRCEIAPDVPEKLVGDPDRLQCVLGKLLANAAKFTEAGEVHLRVGLESPRDGRDWLHLSVRDTGVGISPERQQRIFEAFSNTDGPYKRSHDGVGLGLAMASRLVDLMGGRMWLESVVGAGSTFHFTVPFNRKGQPTGEVLQGVS